MDENQPDLSETSNHQQHFNKVNELAPVIQDNNQLIDHQPQKSNSVENPIESNVNNHQQPPPPTSTGSGMMNRIQQMIGIPQLFSAKHLVMCENNKSTTNQNKNLDHTTIGERDELSLSSTSSTSLSQPQQSNSSQSSIQSTLSISYESQFPQADFLRHKQPLKLSQIDFYAYQRPFNTIRQLRSFPETIDLMLQTTDGGCEPVHIYYLALKAPKFWQTISEYLMYRRQSDNDQLETVVLWTDENFPVTVPAICLPSNIDRRMLQIVCDTMYAGEVQLDYAMTWELLELAHQFNLDFLINVCLNYLTETLCLNNCVLLLQVGLKFDHILAKLAYRYILVNFVRAVRFCETFSELTLNQLITLLNDNELNVGNEIYIWRAIVTWLNVDQPQWITQNPVASQPSTSLPSLPTVPALLTVTAPDQELVTRPPRSQSQISLLINQKYEQQTEEEPRFNQRLQYFWKLFHYVRFNLINWKLVEKEIVKQFCYINDRYDNALMDGIEGNLWNLKLNFTIFNPRIPNQVLFMYGGYESGLASSTIKTYDIRAGKWFKMQLNDEHPRVYHKTVNYNQNLYIVGGSDGIQIYNTLILYDPTTFQYTLKSSMNEIRCFMCAVRYQNFIVVMGGNNGKERLRSCEIYDPSKDIWRYMASMNSARSDAAAAVYNDKIYIAGGIEAFGMSSVEVFSFNSGSWSIVSFMNLPRRSFQLIAYQQYLYAIGGCTDVNEYTCLKSVERYNTETNTWSVVAPMKQRRSSFASAVMEDKLFVFGGYDGFSSYKSTECYNPVANRWDKIGPMLLPEELSAASATVMVNIGNTIDYTYYGQCLVYNENLVRVNGERINRRLIRLMIKKTNECARLKMKQRKESEKKAAEISAKILAEAQQLDNDRRMINRIKLSRRVRSLLCA